MNFYSFISSDCGLNYMSLSSRTPNHLIHEKSPYLLQHAYNPVEWFPWGNSAFEKAKSEDKLVFLSIGYATCHWCHVMERESFEDEKVAEFMNQFFVSVKLDREERPDIDRIYMEAIQAMGTPGGWPLNIFLTPDRKPLTGGTYFPPVRKFGMKSFLEVLVMVDGLWRSKRKEMLQAADDVHKFLLHGDIHSTPERIKKFPSEEALMNAGTIFQHYYDEIYYGFKTNNQNKFPPSMGISFLLAYYRYNNDPIILNIAEKTLQAMKRGGIYDQIGGGISRYSTDHQWLVPHFEKMLYDNSLFLISLVEAWQLTKNSFYKDSALDIINYVERDLRIEEGGISCAEDADSEGEEGKFYIFSYEELRNELGSDFPVMERFWNIKKGGNFDGKNILHENIQIDSPEWIHQMGVDNFKEIYNRSRYRLLEYRSQRVRPLRDDKVLVSWNCLYIQALALAGIAFSDESLIQKSILTFQFLEKKCMDKRENLFRRYRDGEAKYSGQLVDYSGMGLASLSLWNATQDISFFHKACNYAETTLEKFYSQEDRVFYDTEKNPELIRRSIDGYDSVEPSGNSQAAKLFFTLSQFGYKSDEFRAITEGIFSYFNKELMDSGISHSYMLRTFLEYRFLSGELVLTQSNPSAKFEEIRTMIHQAFLPGKIFITMNHSNSKERKDNIEILKERETKDHPMLYICKNQTCKLPLLDLTEVQNFCISPETF